MPDLALPLGLIADPRIHGETDEGAIRLWTDFLNRRMRGNSTTTILAIGQTSKLDTGFVGLIFYAHLGLRGCETQIPSACLG